MQKEIKLTFDWDGKTVKKEVSGFEGISCADATSFIEKGLGTVVATEFKHEYHIPEPVIIDQFNKVSI